MRKETTIALLLAVAAAGATFTKESVEVADQSAQPYPDGRPIASSLSGARRGRLETPEVVLSVKYDRGSIDGIYLAQYRKGKTAAIPTTVPEGTQLCLDLCHAGLGGEGCGSSCKGLVPVGLLEVTQAQGSAELADHTDAPDHAQDMVFGTGGFGRPRTGVCPVLCSNNLGYPLCGCESSNASATVPNWPAVCSVFCNTDSYTLGGCPECTGAAAAVASAARALDTAAGWKAWCSVQCGQGQGGAACNCDLAPFSI